MLIVVCIFSEKTFLKDSLCSHTFFIYPMFTIEHKDFLMNGFLDTKLERHKQNSTQGWYLITKESWKPICKLWFRNDFFLIVLTLLSREK